MTLSPKLRMGRDGKWTPASLQNHYRHRVAGCSHQADRQAFAYGVLSEISLAMTGEWTAAQRRAVARGLQEGMTEAASNDMTYAPGVRHL